MLANLFRIVVWALAVTAIDAERIRDRYLCTPDECVRSDSVVQVGIKISSGTTLNLLPGTYTNASPAAQLLPASQPFLSGFSFQIEPYPGSNFYLSLDSTSRNESESIGWPLIVTGPSTPTTFKQSGYKSSPNLFSLENTISISDEWDSLYLPPGVFFSFPPKLSGVDPRYQNVVFRGSVPLRQGLGRQVRSLDLSTSKGVFGSDACFPACGPGGLCLPSNLAPPSLNTSDASNQSTNNPSPNLHNAFVVSFTCACSPGFAGPTCDDCAPGHFGPECLACPDQCYSPGGQMKGRCDDGFTGTGGCLGSLGNSTQACGCVHGTCTSGNTCECAAGWTDGAGFKCSVCAPGFFLSSENDCQACPLGALTCRSETQATTCSKGYAINVATGSCIHSGGQASCSAGQYWDGSTCSTCSPACDTCTGPGSDQCLKCSNPRFNLNGTCVGYDSSNGICNSLLTGLKGVYVANNVKGRCEACPSGCLACAIPSFSIASVWNDTLCTACQEGWVLQDGKCVEECAAGSFLPEGPPNINGTCEACDKTKCASCYTSATLCSSCARPGEYASAGECVTTCPSGTIKDDTLGRCVPCPSDCATCSEDRTCLSCSSITPILSKGRCSASCPVASYWEVSTSMCTGCADNCTSCTGREVDQCVSCAKGSLMKDETCTPASCTLVEGLGICLRSDLSKEKMWWPYLLVILLLSIFGLITFWWIRRSRRLRRQHTAVFAASLDDNAIDRRARRVGGIRKMLDNMRMNERSTARDSFHSLDLVGPPPAYSEDKSAYPVFSITPPSLTVQGPPRAPATRERYDDAHHEAFETIREYPNRASMTSNVAEVVPSWSADRKVALPDEQARAQHGMV